MREIPTSYEQDRFVVTPVTAKGEQLRFLLQTAGQTCLFADVAEGLGLKVEPAKIPTPGGVVEFPSVPFPAWKEPIPPTCLEGGRIAVAPVPRETTNTAEAESVKRLSGFLGPHWLNPRAWRFDYPAKKLFELERGELPKDVAPDPIGFARFPNGERIGLLPRITIEAGGEILSVLIDSSSVIRLPAEAAAALNDGLPPLRAVSTIVDDVFVSWHRKHPEWRMLAQENPPVGVMIEVPHVRVGSHAVGPVWFARVAPDTYGPRMQDYLDKPVFGAIGGNILRNFRMTLDYEKSEAFFEK